jgi:hypothetical protein
MQKAVTGQHVSDKFTVRFKTAGIDHNQHLRIIPPDFPAQRKPATEPLEFSLNAPDQAFYAKAYSRACRMNAVEVPIFCGFEHFFYQRLVNNTAPEWCTDAAISCVDETGEKQDSGEQDF